MLCSSCCGFSCPCPFTPLSLICGVCPLISCSSSWLGFWPLTPESLEGFCPLISCSGACDGGGGRFCPLISCSGACGGGGGRFCPFTSPSCERGFPPFTPESL